MTHTTNLLMQIRINKWIFATDMTFGAMADFNHDYVNEKRKLILMLFYTFSSITNHADIESFAQALQNSNYTVTSQNDWAPVSVSSNKRRRSNGMLRKREESGAGWGYSLLRWPILLLVGIWLGFLTGLYAVIRFFVAFEEYTLTWRGKRKGLRTRLRQAETYEQWIQSAKLLDEHLNLVEWQHDARFAFYDYNGVSLLIDHLKQLRERGKDDELAIVLQGCVKYNFAGTQGSRLYSQMYYGTKDLVVEFIEELSASIQYLAQSHTISQETKRLSFSLFRRNFGEPALCLSGGATFSYRHFGVVRALLEQGLLPNIVTGTSGGGLVAALVCTRTNEELTKLLVPELADKITACWEPFPFWVRRWYRTGARFDSIDWARRSCWFTRGSMTFREAYERTGKILNISTVPADPHSPTILCNYITCPNAVIWSALLASAAVPGILNPIVLMTKTSNGSIRPFSFGSKWKDGSLRTDIPIQALNTYFNVNFTIVSQVNPHIALFMYGPRGAVGRPVSHRKGKGWRGGFVGSVLENIVKSEIRKWLKLVKDLNLLPRIMDQDWSNIWLQQFKGTVTLFPKMSLIDFWYILSDPNREKLAAMIMAGTRSTFPKILFIKHYFQIYSSIERGIKTMQLTMPDIDQQDISQSKENITLRTKGQLYFRQNNSNFREPKSA